MLRRVKFIATPYTFTTKNKFCDKLIRVQFITYFQNLSLILIGNITNDHDLEEWRIIRKCEVIYTLNLKREDTLFFLITKIFTLKNFFKYSKPAIINDVLLSYYIKLISTYIDGVNILFLSYRTIIISSPIFLFVIFIIHKCIGINLQKKPRKWKNVLKRS